MPTRSHYATALSHAKNSLDWAFVRCLLENGADPAANPQDTHFFRAQIIYSIDASHTTVEEKYEGMIRQYSQKQDKM